MHRDPGAAEPAPADGRIAPRSINATRWLGALDALAPSLIALIALEVARQTAPFGVLGRVAVVTAAVLIAAGAGIAFFRRTAPSHITWPVALALLVLLWPLIALHARAEAAALPAPVPIHLLPLAFTWMALFVTVCAITGYVATLSASQPRWAGVALVPLAVAIGWIPALSLHAPGQEPIAAALIVFALADVAAGIAWLIPERRRWLVIPVALAVGLTFAARAAGPIPQDLRGRSLLLVDAGLAIFAALLALAAPLLCRWIRGK